MNFQSFVIRAYCLKDLDHQFRYDLYNVHHSDPQCTVDTNTGKEIEIGTRCSLNAKIEEDMTWTPTNTKKEGFCVLKQRVELFGHNYLYKE